MIESMKLLHYLGSAALFGAVVWLINPAYAVYGVVVGFLVGIALVPRALFFGAQGVYRIVKTVRAWAWRTGRR